MKLGLDGGSLFIRRLPAPEQRRLYRFFCAITPDLWRAASPIRSDIIFGKDNAAWREIEKFSLLFASRFPVLLKSFPVIFHRVFSLETRMDAGFVDGLGIIFRPDLPFSLYFSLFFGNLNLETGSNPTASANAFFSAATSPSSSF